MDKLPQFKEWECSCHACQKMCERPCYGTVEDIKRIIDAGFGDRLHLDWNCHEADETASIPLLTPALKGTESQKCPSYPRTKEGCTFWKEGKCELHDLKLKPLQGKSAIHTFQDKKLEQKNDEEFAKVKEYIMQSWMTEEGINLVNKWCSENNIADKTLEIDPSEFLCNLSKHRPLDALKLMADGFSNLLSAFAAEMDEKKNKS